MLLLSDAEILEILQDIGTTFVFPTFSMFMFLSLNNVLLDEVAAFNLPISKKTYKGIGRSLDFINNNIGSTFVNTEIHYVRENFRNNYRIMSLPDHLGNGFSTISLSYVNRTAL